MKFRFLDHGLIMVQIFAYHIFNSHKSWAQPDLISLFRFQLYLSGRCHNMNVKFYRWLEYSKKCFNVKKFVREHFFFLCQFTGTAPWTIFCRNFKILLVFPNYSTWFLLKVFHKLLVYYCFEKFMFFFFDKLIFV